MSNRRILSLWFPRLGAERLLRLDRGRDLGPLAVVDDQQNMQVVVSINAAAAQAGVHVGQPVRDAHAMCGTLLTPSRNCPAEARFLTTLRRWAGKCSPRVAAGAPHGPVIGLAGCAHLFGVRASLLGV
ncbi:MAG: DNA polymerase Y family protein, partial [Paracoccaceae bacterium]